jgi:hypothetical protein
MPSLLLHSSSVLVDRIVLHVGILAIGISKKSASDVTPIHVRGPNCSVVIGYSSSRGTFIIPSPGLPADDYGFPRAVCRNPGSGDPAARGCPHNGAAPANKRRPISRGARRATCAQTLEPPIASRIPIDARISTYRMATAKRETLVVLTTNSLILKFIVFSRALGGIGLL